ncbi:MAG: 50S ribosomal protein L2 [Sulfolobaceae archaeon]
MGKRILAQRKGRGNINFRSPSWRRVGEIKYPNIEGYHVGKIINIIKNSGMTQPIAVIKLDNGEKFFNVAVQGLVVGQKIEFGANAGISLGNIVEVGNVPEGTNVCNVEITYGDGGKIARAAGTYAVVIGKSGDKVILRLPSGKIKEVSSKARATIGIVAGGGVLSKPLLKAGNAYWKYKWRAVKWPEVRGVAMNAVSHPHGGGAHQSVSRSSTVSRNAPPGRKVGHIASRRTGRKEGK